jgi:hypothetical protein
MINKYHKSVSLMGNSFLLAVVLMISLTGCPASSSDSDCSQYEGEWALDSNGKQCSGLESIFINIMTIKDCKVILCADQCGTGTVVGDTVSISGQAANGCGGTMRLQGKFASSASVSGTWQDDGGGSGTWWGIKK